MTTGFCSCWKLLDYSQSISALVSGYSNSTMENFDRGARSAHSPLAENFWRERFKSTTGQAEPALGPLCSQNASATISQPLSCPKRILSNPRGPEVYPCRFRERKRASYTATRESWHWGLSRSSRNNGARKFKPISNSGKNFHQPNGAKISVVPGPTCGWESPCSTSIHILSPGAEGDGLPNESRDTALK